MPAGAPVDRAAARPRAAAGRSRRHRQPLHRPRLPARRAAAARHPLEVSRRRQHWPGWTPPRAASATWPAFICSTRPPASTTGLSHAGARTDPGYGRLQGLVFRHGDARFEGRARADAIATRSRRSRLRDGQPQPGQRHAGRSSTGCSGARSPPGYAVQPRNHNAVAAAVVQGRADWGMTLDTIARAAGWHSSRSSTSSSISWCPPRAPDAPA